MALVSALFGQLRPSRGYATPGRRRVPQVVLRGKSGRAYTFEVHRAVAEATRGVSFSAAQPATVWEAIIARPKEARPRRKEEDSRCRSDSGVVGRGR